MSHTYFTESIKHPNKTKCRFEAYEWDGDINKANVIKDNKLNGMQLRSTAEMGYYATKETTKGVYLVVTAVESPYCGKNTLLII